MASHITYGDKNRPFVKYPHVNIHEEELKSDIVILEKLCFADSDFGQYNCFLHEWAQLLFNAIALFKSGYFDCAYYSMRQAVELAIAVLYFHDVSKSTRKEVEFKWANRKGFPSSNRILKELKEQPKHIDIKKYCPNIFSDLSSLQSQLNKIVHKQGYFYLYTIQNHPLIIPNKKQKEFITNFEEYFKRTLKQMFIIRLLIDPMPILLDDSKVHLKKHYLTDPLPKACIDKYIGQEFIEQYKQTELYKKHYE